jgi:predicted DNA-binding WGR domain protein
MWILLKNTEPGHNKFYEMYLPENSQEVKYRYGRINQRSNQISNNYNLLKYFETDREASEYFVSTVSTKLREGYEQVNMSNNPTSAENYWGDASQLSVLDSIGTVQRNRIVLEDSALGGPESVRPEPRIVRTNSPSGIVQVRKYVRNY